MRFLDVFLRVIGTCRWLFGNKTVFIAMKGAAEELVRELMQAEQALLKVTRKLEEEFAARFEGCGVDPMALCKRIQRLQV